MADVPIQVEVAELKGRVAALDRDTNRSIDDHSRSIDRQERRNDELENQVKALQIAAAVTDADLKGMSKLKWTILAAIAAQLLGLITPYIHPTTVTVAPETTRKR